MMMAKMPNTATGLYEWTSEESVAQRAMLTKRIRSLENIESLARGGPGIHYSDNDDILFLVAEVRRLGGR